MELGPNFKCFVRVIRNAVEMNPLVNVYKRRCDFVCFIARPGDEHVGGC